MFIGGYGCFRRARIRSLRELGAELPSLLFDDPLAAVGPTMATVLIREVSHERTRFEYAGGAQLRVLAREIDGPDAVAHVLQVACYQ